MLQEYIDTGVATPARIADAIRFTEFDAALCVSYDSRASRILEKDYWRVEKAFKFYVGNRANDTWVYVPAGFLTDGATVPRMLWGWIPPWGRHGQAAVVHDLLCEVPQLYRAGQLVTIDRSEADSIFKEAMKVAGVSYLKRSVMYWGVRFWDRIGWKRNSGRFERKRKLEEIWRLVERV